MSDAILVINAGSSSIKFSVFARTDDDLVPSLHGQVDGLLASPHLVARDAKGGIRYERRWDPGSGLDHSRALEYLLRILGEELETTRILGIGHRVVHGGLVYSGPVRIDEEVIRTLERFIPLAPLHQPHNLTPIRALRTQASAIPQVACFDTAFHRTIPDLAQRFALPGEYFDDGIRRYGFHGLSYEYIAGALQSVDARAARGRTIVLHLGNGASMCALDAGRSIATTMGFTAVDGLPMGTRSGNLDPGVILYLLDQRGMDARAIERLIYNEAGLLGVSAMSSDMRTLLASQDSRARLAIDLYVYRIRRELGSLVAALGGLDAIVFTAGIGENAALIRQRVCIDTAWAGVELDDAANRAGERRISTQQSRIGAWVIPTNEELMIARHTRDLLGV